MQGGKKEEKKKPCKFRGRATWNSSQLLVFPFWLLSGSVFGFLSPKGSWVGCATSGSTACISFPCLYRELLLGLRGWGLCVSPGKQCSVFWENGGCIPPAPIPLMLVCPILFPIMFSYWLNSYPCHGMGDNLCKRIRSLLLGVVCSSV